MMSCVIKCYGQLAQLVRALGSHLRGQRFKSSTAHFELIVRWGKVGEYTLMFEGENVY